MSVITFCKSNKKIRNKGKVLEMQQRGLTSRYEHDLIPYPAVLKMVHILLPKPTTFLITFFFFESSLCSYFIRDTVAIFRNFPCKKCYEKF